MMEKPCCARVAAHLDILLECPHSHEQKNGVYVTEEVTGAPDIEVDRFILYISGSEELSRFTAEAINSAALDTP